MEPTKPLPNPTPAELAILRVLWKHGESTVRDVHEQLAETQRTVYTTVLKLMQIMVRKGLLTRKEQGRAHVYVPAEKAGDSRQSIVDDMIDRAFGGSARQLVLHALSSQAASTEDLSEIRQMLDQLEAKHG